MNNINVLSEDMVRVLKAIIDGKQLVFISSYSNLRWSGFGNKLEDRKFQYDGVNKWDLHQIYLEVEGVTVHGNEVIELPSEFISFFMPGEWLEFNKEGIKQYLPFIEMSTSPFNTTNKLRAMGIEVPVSLL